MNDDSIWRANVFRFCTSCMATRDAKSDEGLTLETSALPFLPYGCITYFINSFDYPNLLRFERLEANPYVEKEPNMMPKVKVYENSLRYGCSREISFTSQSFLSPASFKWIISSFLERLALASSDLINFYKGTLRIL